jgi:hypothetical protein
MECFSSPIHVLGESAWQKIEDKEEDEDEK